MAPSPTILLVLGCMAAALIHGTHGQTRILTGAGEEDPLKCYTADGLAGDCRPWRYCRVVRQEYPKKKPTICLYRPKNPIVCCPRKSSVGFTTTRRPSTTRPTTNPWRPISAPRPQQSGQDSKVVFGTRPQQRPQNRPSHRPVVFGSGPSSGSGNSERLNNGRGYLGHKDCGLITLSVRADFDDQLELRRRRRRSPLSRSHASAPSAAEDPFAIFDSQLYPEEEEDPDYVAYTESPPPAGSEDVAFTEPPPTATGGAGETTITSGGKFLHVKILPHEPGAASLVYGDAEEGYQPDYYDVPSASLAETYLIRTGKAVKVDDPFGINSQEYRDKISKQLKDAHFITAGKNTIVGQWPWIALIGERREFHINWFCGGSLLNEEFIITAAHCLGKFQKNRLVVRVGEFDLNYDTDVTHQDLLVDRIILHPEYVHRKKHHDIALLHLSRRVRLGGNVRPVCLPLRDAEFTGIKGTVAGWGHTEFGGEKSAILQEVQLSLVNTTACENKYRTLGRAFQFDFAPGFGDTKICAHDTEGGGRDSCQGDSGGPMTYRDPASGRVQIVGIVSSGVGCGHPKFPGVYTRVSKYVDWIMKRAFKNQ